MAKTIARMNAKLGMDSRQFSAGANDAVKKSRGMGRSFEESGKSAKLFGSSIVATGLKAVAAFGAAELALGSINAATAAFSGDIESAAEAVKQLPAGIGPFARQLETAIGSVSGLRAEIDGLKRSTDAMNASFAIQADNFAEITKASRRFEDANRGLANAQALEGLTGGAANVERARIAAAEQMLQIERSIEDTRAAQRELAGKNVKDNTADAERILAINEELHGLENGIGVAVSRRLGRFDDEIAALKGERQLLERNIDLRRQRITNLGIERGQLEELQAQYRAAGEASIKAAEQANRLDPRVFEMWGELREQLDNFGKSADQIAFAQLKEIAPPHVLSSFASMQQQLKALEDQQRATADAAARHNAILARGAATTDRYMTSAQRFANRFADLREEFALGAVGFKTFIRATADAARQARGPGQVAAPAIDNAARRGPVSAITAGGAEDIRLRLAAGSERPGKQPEEVKELKRVNVGVSRMTAEIVKMRLAAGAEVNL